jgi:hypothetical protein
MLVMVFGKPSQYFAQASLRFFQESVTASVLPPRRSRNRPKK